MTQPAALTVLHVNTERGWRGGERQVYWLATTMSTLGARSFVAARRGEELITRLEERGIVTVPVQPRSEFDPIAAWRLRRVVRAEGVQVVHAHTGHAVALAALATVGTGASLVVTRRVNAPLRRNPGTRWKYARARRIIALSEAIAGTLEAGGIPRAKIEVIPSGVDLDRTVDRAAQATVESLGVPAGSSWAVQVGALDPSKDPLTFVGAIAVARRAVPALHGVLVGEGPLRAAIEREIDRRGLRANVHLAGQRADADALLAAADVAVLSSREEGLGTVLLDAMAFGTPVIATKAGGIPDIVEDRVTGLLVPVADSEALGNAIAHLVRDRELAVRLTSAARARVRGFAIEAIARRTLDLYRRVLAEGA